MLSLCYQPTRKFALAVLRTSNRGKRNFIVSDLIRFGEKYFCGQYVCVMMTNSDSTTMTHHVKFQVQVKFKKFIKVKNF